MSTVRLVSGSGEDLIIHLARMSAPQPFDTQSKLLSHCIWKGDWNIFEMADMTIEVKTCRDIATQLYHHRSFQFQEFDDEAQSIEFYNARRHDVKSSLECMSDKHIAWFKDAQVKNAQHAEQVYKIALDIGVAKEIARLVLPMGSSTRLYMKGSIRSWIFFLSSSLNPGIQREIRDIATEIKKIFFEIFPVVGGALVDTADLKMRNPFVVFRSRRALTQVQYDSVASATVEGNRVEA